MGEVEEFGEESEAKFGGIAKTYRAKTQVLPKISVEIDLTWCTAAFLFQRHPVEAP